MKLFYSLFAFLLITILLSVNSYAQQIPTIDEHLEQPLYLKRGAAIPLRLEPKEGLTDANIRNGEVADLASIYEASRFRLRVQLEYRKAKERQEAIVGNFKVYIKGKLERVDATYDYGVTTPDYSSTETQPPSFDQEFELEIHQTFELDNDGNYTNISQTLLDYQLLGIFKKEELLKIGTEGDPGYKTAIWIEEIIVEDIDALDPNNDVIMLSIIPEAMPEYGKVGDEFAPTLINAGANLPFVYDTEKERLKWNYIQNANYYEVEWVFVDFYDKQYSINTFSSEASVIAAAQNAFDNYQGVRIQTSDKYHMLRIGTEITYPKGLVFFRVRGVGKRLKSENGDIPPDYEPNYDEAVTVKGKWIINPYFIRLSDPADPSNPSYTPPSSGGYQIAKIKHEPKRNWQYATTFAEEGKYKKVMSYFSSSLRQNQTLTNFTTDREDDGTEKSITLVEEHFTDYEGRGVIQTIPAPLATASLTYQTALGGQTSGADPKRINFFGTTATDDDLNPDNVLHTKSAYDRDHKQGASQPLAIGSLTREYYGVADRQHPLLTPFDDAIHDKYIPESDGYAYTQVKYTNDGTGRIKAQSGVGETFAMGNDREVKYFYLTPSKKELTRLFGEDIGDVSHYKKVLSVDPNKQKSVAYIDQAGQTIATALVGESPDMLRSIRDPEEGNVTVDLIKSNKKETTKSVTKHNFYNAVDNTLYTFDYTMDGAITEFENLDDEAFCRVCTYELHIYLINDQGVKQEIKLYTAFDDPDTAEDESETINIDEYVKEIKPNSDDNTNNDYDEESEDRPDWCEQDEEENLTNTVTLGLTKLETINLSAGEYTLIKELVLTQGDGTTFQSFVDAETQTSEFEERTTEEAEGIAEENCTYCADYVDENGNTVSIGTSQDCPEIIKSLNDFAADLASFECETIWQRFITEASASDIENNGWTLENPLTGVGAVCYDACVLLAPSREYDVKMNDVSKNFVDLFSISILFIDPFSSDPFWQSLIDVLDDGTSISDIRNQWDNYSITYNGQSYNIQNSINSPETYQDIENNPDLTALQKVRAKHKRQWDIFSGGYQHFKRAKMRLFYREMGCSEEKTNAILPDQDPLNDLLNPNNADYDEEKDENLNAFGNTEDCGEWARIKAESLVFGAYAEGQACQGWNVMTQEKRQELIELLIPDFEAYCKGSSEYITMDNQFRKLYYDQGCTYTELQEFFTFAALPNAYGYPIIENNVLVENPDATDPVITSYRLVKWFANFIGGNSSRQKMKLAFKAHFDRQAPQTGADPANPFHYTEAEWNNLAPSVVLAYIELSIRAADDDNNGNNCDEGSQAKATNDALNKIKESIKDFEYEDGNIDRLCLTPFYAILSPIACRAYEEETIMVRTFSKKDQLIFTNQSNALLIPDSEEYDDFLRNDFTIDVVINPGDLNSSIGQEIRFLSTNTAVTGIGDTYFSFGLEEFEANSYRLYFYSHSKIGIGNDKRLHLVTNQITLNPNSCYRFTFQRDTDGNAVFLVDGVVIGHSAFINHYTDPLTQLGSLDNIQFFIGDRFRGSIQEVLVWSSTNIPVMSSSTQLPVEFHDRADLLGYWKLEVENDAILDYSTNGNHIPYANAPTEPIMMESQSCLLEEKTVRVCSAYDENFSDVSTSYTMDDVMAACVEEKLVGAKKETIRIRREQRTVLSNRLEEKYNNDCFKSPFKETLTMSYNNSEHHYTLYYYDQAGNLYQTVPPEGVNPDGSGVHTLKTEYHYNTLGQVVWQKTPDRGVSQRWVDYYGRVRLSQNQEQSTTHTDPTRQDEYYEYTYIKYDDLDRPYEGGKIDILSTAQDDPFKSVSIDDLVYSNNFPEQGEAIVLAPTAEDSRATTTLSFGLSERTIIYYGNAQIAHPEGEYIVNPEEQHYLRNRVAAMAVYEEGETIGAVTRYSYTIHGHVEHVWQRLPKVSVSDNPEEDIVIPEKNSFYIYDLISGRINQVVYQGGKEDEFRHRYDYDGNARVTSVHTSLDGIHWTLEARYFPYAHGSLARIEVGQYNIQGVDYYNTLQGFLKGVNSPEGTFGKDGTEDNPSFNADEFAYTLHYYEGDYKARGGNAILGNIFTTDQDYSLFTGFFDNGESTDGLTGTEYKRENLYNGNVAAMTTSIKHFGDAGGIATQSMNYRYDQLHRIAAANSRQWNPESSESNKWETTGNGAGYQTSYTYDGNGNIQNLQRRNQIGEHIDKLEYTYNSIKKNRLENVTDAINNIPNADPSENGLDFNGGNAHEYKYDEIGNLVKNTSDGIQNIVWNIQGKVEKVVRTNATILYRYDASGDRIIKQVITPDANKISYYLRNESGEVLAIYEYNASTETTSTPAIAIKEIPIYGTSRLGHYRPIYDDEGQIVKSTALGQRMYEFSNHLDNVLLVLADYKIPKIDEQGQVQFKSFVVAANDYYPFGMAMTGRSYHTEKYRYGFNGKEKDNDFGDKQLIQDYGFRLYNPAIARFLSVDPLAPSYPELTVYQFASNTPIQAIDLDGLEAYRNEIMQNTRIKLFRDGLITEKEMFGGELIFDYIFYESQVWYVGGALEAFAGLGRGGGFKLAKGVAMDRDGNYALISASAEFQTENGIGKSGVHEMAFGGGAGVAFEASAFAGLDDVYGLAGSAQELTIPLFFVDLAIAKDMSGKNIGYGLGGGLGWGLGASTKVVNAIISVFREEDLSAIKEAYSIELLYAPVGVKEKWSDTVTKRIEYEIRMYEDRVIVDGVHVSTDLYFFTEEVYYYDWSTRDASGSRYVQTTEQSRRIISQSYATTLYDRGGGVWNTEAAEKARPPQPKK